MTTYCLEYLLSFFQNIFFILIGCFGMGFLIGFHELGHFLFAKLFNIRTPSFSIGFGPKLISKKIGGTEFSISAIPLGGYVEIAGASEIGQGDQHDAYAIDEGSFATKPYYQKLCVMLGGIFFNLTFAYLAMIILFMTGIPKTPLIQKPIITAIHEKSSAEKYGLEIGDKIIAIHNQPIQDNIQQIQTILQPLALEETNITIERNNKILDQTIVVGEKIINDKSIGVLGVEFDMSPTAPQSFLNAIQQGIAMTNQWIKNTITGFTQLKKNHSQMAGPVMIIAMTTQAATAGFKIFMLLLAIISINLAILNIIPLPILDGGQILLYTIEALLQRPLPERLREYIALATWVLFLALFLFLTTKDIYRLASPYIKPLLSYIGL